MKPSGKKTDSDHISGAFRGAEIDTAGILKPNLSINPPVAQTVPIPTGNPTKEAIK